MIGDKTTPLHNRGFTLVEVLVALSIFSIVITIASDFFISFQRTQRATEALQGVSSSARQVMERIVAEVAEHQVDYASYPSATAPLPAQSLVLKDDEGNRIFFRQEDSEICPDAAGSPCAAMSLNGEEWSALTPRGVRVRALNFYISPSRDPFFFDTATNAYAADAQPIVTVVLDMEGDGIPGASQSRVTLQTAVESRVYKR